MHFQTCSESSRRQGVEVGVVELEGRLFPGALVGDVVHADAPDQQLAAPALLEARAGIETGPARDVEAVVAQHGAWSLVDQAGVQLQAGQRGHILAHVQAQTVLGHVDGLEAVDFIAVFWLLDLGSNQGPTD